MSHRHVLIIILCALLFTSAYAFGQKTQNTEIKVEKLTDNIFVLSGEGGNVGVLTGEDGVLIIDTFDPGYYPKLTAKIAEITGNKPIRFVINTHWHYDHIGSNESMAKAGIPIIAHENVRKRMSSEQYVEFFKAKVPPSPSAALPIITFTKEITLFLNGEEIHVLHIQPGHTDGDSVIFFKKANVIQTGDIYFSNSYPFIDSSTGGSTNNMITALNKLLPDIDNSTKIIPGHGPVSNKSQLLTYIDMLTHTTNNVAALIKKGKKLEETISAKPNKEFDSIWGNDFMKPDQYVTLLYMDLSKKELHPRH
jgi:cyclase